MESPQLPPPPPLLPLHSAGSTILVKYQLTRFLGCSSFTKVYQAQSLIDRTTVVAKIIDKSKTVDAAMEPRIVGEIDAMRRLHHHPNILLIHEVMATKTKIYLIIEFAGDGELFSKIYVVSMLSFCHLHGVTHRDLKPQNLLLDADSNLKAFDFGFSALPKQLKNGLLYTTCGTPAYTATEILCRRSYDSTKVIAWSCRRSSA